MTYSDALFDTGATCLMGGAPSCGSDCSGSPWLPLLYIGFNLGFNIAALNLLKTAGEPCSLTLLNNMSKHYVTNALHSVC